MSPPGGTLFGFGWWCVEVELGLLVGMDVATSDVVTGGELEPGLELYPVLQQMRRMMMVNVVVVVLRSSSSTRVIL